MTAPPVYPVSLVVAGRPCLVVGGGEIAARKAAGLVSCGARVSVVAPSVGEQMRSLGEAIEIQERAYRAGEASSYALVISATGVARVDRSVAQDASDAGVWVNVADDPALCTVMLPAIARRGPVTVAVSTGGMSPALASWLRDRMIEWLPQEVEQAAERLSEIRAELHANGASTESVDWSGILDGLFSSEPTGEVAT